MALVPNTSPVLSTTPAANTRAVNTPTRVASVSTNQVDAIELTTDISFDAAASGFENQEEQARLAADERQQRGRFGDPGINRLFTSNTESFAAILEDPNRSSDNVSENTRGRTATPVGKIINTYETNARIITGQQPVRGTSLSFSL